MAGERARRGLLRRLVTAGAALALITALAAAAALTHRHPGRTFESDGVSLHYTDEGSGAPVVLLHGFAVNGDLNWRRPGLLDALAASHRVITLDQRGHGLSGKPHHPGGYGGALTSDVVALLDELKLERAWVVGYSLGGFVALKLATLHPERLEGVGVMGAGWEAPDESRFLDAMRRMANILDAGGSIGPLASHLGDGRPPPGVIHTAWVNLMTGLLNDKQALAALIRSISALEVTGEDLRGLLVPVCSIVGDEDPLLPGAEALRDTAPQVSQTIVTDADHMQAVGRAETREALLSCVSKQLSPIDVHGHRGARAVLPENTLPAFRDALSVGADYLELDTVVTADDHVVVMHDPVPPAELCVGEGGAPPPPDRAVRSMTLAELKRLDCGARPNPKFPGQRPVPGARIPTLEEVLALATAPADGRPADAPPVQLNIETKIRPDHPDWAPAPDRFAQLVIDALRQAGLQDRTVLQSFDPRTLQAAARIAPEIRRSLLIASDLQAGLAMAASPGVKAAILSPAHRLVDPAAMRAVRAAGLQVVPWTANTPEDWRRLVSLEVDGIITDDPQPLIAWLRTIGRHR